jgi:hypothetical protein
MKKQQVKKKKSRRGRRTTRRKKEMHPEIKESLKHFYQARKVRGHEYGC